MMMKANHARGMRVALASVLAGILACAFMLFAQPNQQAHAADATPADTQIMYRIYNPNSGEHFFTASTVERDNCIKAGWNDEGRAWLATKTGSPVYRLYNKNGGEHHYTLSLAEKNNLVSKGWTYEGIGWYSNANKGVKLYRVYNPNEFANNHHYTTSEAEKNSLVSKGWRYEGEAWYGAEWLATIDIKDYGTIKLTLDSTAAPKTVDNFVKLAQKNYYDGLKFHRAVKDFMMQGGDPDANGTGGNPADGTLEGEFSSNGFDNNLSHTRGTISMARSSNYDSAGSQFFIVHKDSTFLDGNYAAFGRVTSGLEVVDAICNKTVDQGVLNSLSQVDSDSSLTAAQKAEKKAGYVKGTITDPDQSAAGFILKAEMPVINSIKVTLH